jgi:hypothetical protein
MVLGFNIYMLISLRTNYNNQEQRIADNSKYVQQMSDDVDIVLKKINGGINYKIDSSTMSILDLAEFKDLDPYLKAEYKKYIVEVLAPGLMKGINKTMNDNDMRNYLEKHDQEINDMVYNIAKELQTNGVNSMPNMLNAASVSSNKPPQSNKNNLQFF